MTIRADVTLPGLFRGCGRQCIVEAELRVVARPIQDDLSPEPRVELDVEGFEVETGATTIEENCIGNAPVILLRQPIEIAVCLSYVVGVRALKGLDAPFGLALSEKERLTVAVDDNRIRFTFDPNIASRRFAAKVDPDRVSNILISTGDFGEIGNDNLLLELGTNPENALWIGIFFGGVLLTVERLSMALKQLARAMPFGCWDTPWPIEIGLTLSDILRELAFTIPVGKTHTTDRIEECLNIRLQSLLLATPVIPILYLRFGGHCDSLDLVNVG